VFVCQIVCVDANVSNLFVLTKELLSFFCITTKKDLTSALRLSTDETQVSDE